MFFLKKKTTKAILILICLVLGLFLRLTLVTKAHHQDLDALKKGSVFLLDYSWKEYYQRDQAARYLPIIPILLWSIGITYKSFFDHNFNLTTPINNNILYLYKLPAIIFDLLTGLVVFLILNKTLGAKKGFIYFFALLINPVIIFISAVWGQNESIYLCFLLLSVYCLQQKNNIWGLFFYFMALFTKPQSIIIAPIIFIYFLLFTKNKYSLISLILGMLPFFSILFFTDKNPLLWLFNFFRELTSLGATATVSASAFNLWSLLTGFTTYITETYGSFTYQTWGFLIFGIIYLLILIKFIRNLIRKNDLLIETIFITYLTYFVLSPQVRERYLYPALVFLYLLIDRNKLKIITLILLTIINFYNLTYFSPSYPGIFSIFIVFPFNLLKNWLTFDNGYFSSIIILILFFIEFYFYLVSNKNVKN